MEKLSSFQKCIKPICVDTAAFQTFFHSNHVRRLIFWTQLARIDTACHNHESSRAHPIAAEKNIYYRECDKSDRGRGTIIHQLVNTEGQQFEMMARNREHIKVILDIVLMCAMQEISLRRNREN